MMICRLGMIAQALCLLALLVFSDNFYFADAFQGGVHVAVASKQRSLAPMQTSSNLRTLAPRQINQRSPWKKIAPTKSGLGKGSTALCLWSRGDDEIEGIGNRIRCCFPYLLPLMDGDHFGRYIYERIPPLGFVDEVLLGPLVSLNTNIPFLGLAFFVVLTLGTRFNLSMDRNIRFNAQQAALIDVALLFPELIASGFQEGDLPRSLAEPCSNFVWYAYMTAVVYSVYYNLRGKKPSEIPYISNLSETMVGPF